MTSDKQLAFVAYPSFDTSLSACIQGAIFRANALPIPIRYEPWIFNDVAGTPIVSPILERIEESAFVVADITYLNPNVVYEIGYAIGQRKRVFLLRSKAIQGDKRLAYDAGIFDTLGYFEYSSEEALRDRLSSHIDEAPLDYRLQLDNKAPIYIVEPPIRDQALTIAISRIKKAGYRFRSFNPIEDTRLSASDAIRQVAASSGVVTLLQDATDAHAIRAMFVLGLADGMGKPALLLVPKGLKTPLDIRDFAKQFSDPGELREHINKFVPEVTRYSQEIDPPAIQSSNLLASLSIGDPTAENEMTTLGRYFLRTDQYLRALRGEVNLVVGRKGSGKTALFIQIRDKIRSDKRNIVVDLKPEGYQLLKLKEQILQHLNEGARQHLVTAFWEYLILLEVAYKLLEKDRKTHQYNHEITELYRELESVYRTDAFTVEGDFSERLSSLSAQIADKFREIEEGKISISAGGVSQLVYVHDIRLLRERISDYLHKKNAVWVLFDNLDKGWSTHGVDEIDAMSLRCLIDAGRKVEREMAKSGHVFHCVIFVRNDVYEKLMQNSADYGKDMRVTLDWTDPDLLREMLRLRLVSGLDETASKVEFLELWQSVCVSHVNGEESSSYVIDRSLMRPRNLLKVFNHIRGFASNFNHAKIEESDVQKGLKAYSQDLLVELDREISDVLPSGKDVIYRLLDAAVEMDRAQLQEVMALDSSSFGSVLEFLLYYGVLGIRVDEVDYFIYDTHYDLKPLMVRADRAGASCKYIINAAFWLGLGITPLHGE